MDVAIITPLAEKFIGACFVSAGDPGKNVVRFEPRSNRQPLGRC